MNYFHLQVKQLLFCLVLLSDSQKYALHFRTYSPVQLYATLFFIFNLFFSHQIWKSQSLNRHLLVFTVKSIYLKWKIKKSYIEVELCRELINKWHELIKEQLNNLLTESTVRTQPDFIMSREAIWIQITLSRAWETPPTTTVSNRLLTVHESFREG